MRRPVQSVQDIRAKRQRVALKLILRDAEVLARRIARAWKAVQAWFAGHWKGDRLLVIVAFLCAIGGAAVLTHPAVAWGIGQ